MFLLLWALYLIPGLITAFFLGHFQYMITRYVEDPVVRKIMAAPLPTVAGLVCLWAAVQMGELRGEFLALLAFFCEKWGFAATIAGYGLLGILLGGWMGQRDRKRDGKP